MPELPKPFGAILLGIIAVFILIILYAVITGGGKSTGLGDIAAHAQEISRVSKLVQNQAEDQSTKSLAATTAASLDSDIAQFQSYLKSNGGKKISVKSLAIYKKTSVDADVQNASQNKTIATYYKTYLKDNLTPYQTSLKTAFDSGNSKLKPILTTSYNNAQTILDSL